MPALQNGPDIVNAVEIGHLAAHFVHPKQVFVAVVPAQVGLAVQMAAAHVLLRDVVKVGEYQHERGMHLVQCFCAQAVQRAACINDVHQRPTQQKNRLYRAHQLQVVERRMKWPSGEVLSSSTCSEAVACTIRLRRALATRNISVGWPSYCITTG